MRKLLLVLCLAALLIGCGPKVDPVEPIRADYITVEVYWVSYCEYCLEELSILEEISLEMVGHPYLDGKVRIIAHNVDLGVEELQAILLGEGPSFTLTTGHSLPRWSNSFPTIVIKDTLGVMKFQWIGLANKAELYSMIMETLGFIEKV